MKKIVNLEVGQKWVAKSKTSLGLQWHFELIAQLAYRRKTYFVGCKLYDRPKVAHSDLVIFDNNGKQITHDEYGRDMEFYLAYQTKRKSTFLRL